MDKMGSYVGGGNRILTRKEIENMKKNMKKVPIIQLKSDIYHKSEELVANKIIEIIPQIKPQITTDNKKEINTDNSIDNNEKNYFNNIINWFEKILRF